MSVNEVKLKKAAIDFAVEGPPSSRTFTIGDEDHTLGNALRHVLVNNHRDVQLAAYSVPHPSEPILKVRVQTHKADPNSMEDPPSATEVLKTGCRTLHDQCGIVLERLETLFPSVKEDRLKIEKHIMEEEYDESMEDEDDSNK